MTILFHNTRISAIGMFINECINKVVLVDARNLHLIDAVLLYNLASRIQCFSSKRPTNESITF
jgi:hypothetical protein